MIGVSGSGKTTIGKKIANTLGIDFYDADDFHPDENIRKMEAGIPLNDEDRAPWLKSVNSFVSHKLEMGSLVFACSALKDKYRVQLSKGITNQTVFIFLEGDYNLILSRMQRRKNHFMPSKLLRSQFNDLEIPNKAIRVSIAHKKNKIVEYILEEIKDGN